MKKHYFVYFPLREGKWLMCKHKHKTYKAALACTKKQKNSAFWKVGSNR